MATKRNVLDLFSRAELLAAVGRLGLTVPDRRARAGLVRELSASKKAGLQDLLVALPRERGQVRQIVRP